MRETLCTNNHDSLQEFHSLFCISCGNIEEVNRFMCVLRLCGFDWHGGVHVLGMIAVEDNLE